MKINTVLDSDFERFVDFSSKVYEGDPFWNPLSEKAILPLLSGESPFARDQEASKGFWIEKDGRILARVFAQVDKEFQEFWKNPDLESEDANLGHLFFFEAMPNCMDESRLLLNHAKSWLRERGCDSARLSYLHCRQLPLTKTYHCKPTFLHTYNKPYYHEYLLGAGFFEEKTLHEFRVDFTQDLFKSYNQIITEANQRGVYLESFNFQEWEKDTEKLRLLQNSTFGHYHWGSTQVDFEQMKLITKDIEDLIDPEFLVFAFCDSQLCGFIFGLPDLNQAVSELSDDLDLEKISHGVLMNMGVDPMSRGKRVAPALLAKVCTAMIKKGYKSASFSLILEENIPSRRAVISLGGVQEREFIVYRNNF